MASWGVQKLIKIMPWGAKGPPSAPRLVAKVVTFGIGAEGRLARGIIKQQNHKQVVDYLTRRWPMATRISLRLCFVSLALNDPDCYTKKTRNRKSEIWDTLGNPLGPWVRGMRRKRRKRRRRQVRRVRQVCRRRQRSRSRGRRWRWRSC